MSAPEETSQPVAVTARLVMREVSKSFGATHALKGVNLQVHQGEVLGLVGENGAGKSTLMKVLSGAHKADAGTMSLDGAPYNPIHPLTARQSGVAMIYQELSLAPHLSVTENILLGVEPGKGPFINWSAAHATASKALARVGLSHISPRTIVSSLSVAQQQLVEIARAVALKSRVLVFDEPTSSLTQADIRQLFALIHSLRQEGLAIIYISHFLEEIAEICDRFTVLRDGESVGEGQVADTPPEKIIALMVGREVDDLYPRHPHDQGESILSVRELKGRRLPRQASLDLHRGEVVGIAGLVGAGRTELMRAIFGLEEVMNGTISIAEINRKGSPRLRWRQGVGMVSEDRKNEGLALGLSIADNLTLSRLTGLGRFGLVSPFRQRAACLPWIKRLPIKCADPSQPVSDLSGGNQQKVAIARLLHADVDVLLMDEPTRGIDVAAKAEVYKLIDEMACGNPENELKPKAILIISSYLPELLGICDRIGVMCKGELREVRPVDAWSEHELMLVATGQDQERQNRERTDNEGVV